MAGDPMSFLILPSTSEYFPGERFFNKNKIKSIKTNPPKKLELEKPRDKSIDKR